MPLMGHKKRVGPARTHLLETEVDGDISIYDPRTEQVTVLNSTASDVWRLADGTHGVDEITGLLATAYGVQPDKIRADVRETVDLLSELGLFEGE
jgi:hypothetical protein